jgi:predicted TIM-barrel fold metal-dependent hydrolase
MDKIGVDAQVIYPTLFLVYLTDDAKLETALCRAYNRFIANACATAPDRLKWAVILPLRDIEASLTEMRWAKEQGTVGVFFRGMEGNLTLDNPYFNPVYALAEKLDLTVCIHTGSGSRHLMQLFDVQRNHTFAHNRVLPVVAFRDLVANRIPEQFPKLRFGFIEAAASWVPYIFHVLRRSVRSDLKNKNPQELFHDYRFWIACEADEELPHLLNYIGEDHIVIGSDYGHNDPSKEPEFVKHMRAREDVAPQIIEKILRQNPRWLYGLDRQ